MIAYFLLLGVVNIIIPNGWPFVLLAWPLYVFPESTFLAAVFELLFAYALAAFVSFLLARRRRGEK